MSNKSCLLTPNNCCNNGSSFATLDAASAANSLGSLYISGYALRCGLITVGFGDTANKGFGIIAPSNVPGRSPIIAAFNSSPAIFAACLTVLPPANAACLANLAACNASAGVIGTSAPRLAAACWAGP